MANIHRISDYPSASQQQRSYVPLDLPIPTKNAPRTRSGKTCLAETGEFFESIFGNFKFKSFTFITTIVQIVIFIFGVVYAAYLSKNNEVAYTCVLYELGAKFTPAIVGSYHLHRLVFPILLHGNVAHIFGNMIGQLSFGFQLEARYGTKKFAILYILAGIGGNLLSATLRPEALAVGASTSLFGIIAWRCVYLWENYDNLGPGRNRMILWMAFILLMNVGAGNRADNVDNHGHAGGFFTGLMVALQLVLSENVTSSFRRKQKIALGLLIVFGVFNVAYLIFLHWPLKGSANAIQELCQEIGFW